jgi:hypothetical protein
LIDQKAVLVLLFMKSVGKCRVDSQWLLKKDQASPGEKILPAGCELTNAAISQASHSDN